VRCVTVRCVTVRCVTVHGKTYSENTAVDALNSGCREIKKIRSNIRWNVFRIISIPTNSVLKVWIFDTANW
jgi:hypothetical protein